VSNTIFSLKALVIVAILVGLSTYILVFNLNNVVEFCGQVYSKRKLKIIEQMNKDLDSRWKEQGQRFTIFQPKHERHKPSEWMLGLFLLHRIFGGFHLTRPFSRNEEQKTVQSDKKGSIPYWPNLPFPGQAAPSKKPTETQTTQTAEVRKKSSVRERFARLSMVFRRGAFSPHVATDV
jgi:hypothetical protein